ncbi:MAG: MerC domain-containing protein [Rhodothermaceae bacterium]
MDLVIKKYFAADNIGMTSSTLCLIHCMITPFIFIAQACTASCCADAPVWWKTIDFLFLVISFVAVYYSAKTTSKIWMRYTFYFSFILLFFLIINDHLVLFEVAKTPLYITAGLLAGLHFYNRKYCLCQSTCCESNSK